MEKSQNPYQSPAHDPSEPDIQKAQAYRAERFSGPLLSLSTLSFVLAALISSASFHPRTMRWQYVLVGTFTIIGAITLALSYYLHRGMRNDKSSR